MKIEELTEMNNFKMTLETCARCGLRHPDVLFVKLQRAMGEFTHWASCPQTGEPMMMKFKVEPN